ncbi:MAG: hypothetical protein ACRC62_26680 [Microcoleus sp.]
MAVASAVFSGGSWKDSPDAYTTRKLYHYGDRIDDLADLNLRSAPQSIELRFDRAQLHASS